MVDDYSSKTIECVRRDYRQRTDQKFVRLLRILSFKLDLRENLIDSYLRKNEPNKKQGTSGKGRINHPSAPFASLRLVLESCVLSSIVITFLKLDY